MAAVMGRPCMARLMLCSTDSDDGDASNIEEVFKEDLLSDKAKILSKLSKYGHGRPSKKFVDRIADPEEKKRVERLCEQFDELDGDKSGDPSSMSYCYLYFTLLVAAVVRGRSTNCSFHDGDGSIRGSIFLGPDSTAEYYLALASLRRAMSLWSNPYVLIRVAMLWHQQQPLLLQASVTTLQKRYLGVLLVVKTKSSLGFHPMVP